MVGMEVGTVVVMVAEGVPGVGGGFDCD
jgi:hypothetical protein